MPTLSFDLPQITSPRLTAWLSPADEPEDEIFFPTAPRLGSPERSQSPAQGVSVREKQQQALVLPNNTNHGWKLLPNTSSSAGPPPSLPKPPSRPRRMQLHHVDPHGPKKPSNIPQPPSDSFWSDHFRWPRQWQPPNEILAQIKGLIPPQLVPLLGALSGLLGGLRTLSRMWHFSRELEDRSLWSSRQLRNLTRVDAPAPAVAQAEIQRQRQAHVLEGEALRAAMRAGVFHIINQLVELACIAVAAVPAMIGILRLAPGAGLMRSIAYGMPLLLGANGVMSLLRYGGELAELDGLSPDILEVESQPSWLSWLFGLGFLADTSTPWQPSAATQRSRATSSTMAAVSLAAEQSYLRRQVAAWTCFTAGIACVSGGLFSGAWASALGATLLAVGIVMSQLQHVLHGRRYDVPEVLWHNAPKPHIDAPASLLGSMVFDPLSCQDLTAVLLRDQHELRVLREALKPIFRPSLRFILEYLPQLLRMEVLAALATLALQWGLNPHRQAAAAAVLSAQIGLERGRQRLFAHLARERLDRLTQLLEHGRQVAPSANMPHSPQTNRPIDEVQAAILLEAEHLMFVQAEEAAQAKITALDAMDGHADVDTVLQGVGGPQNKGFLALGTTVWEMHHQVEAWRTSVVWCTKIARVRAQPHTL